jgi:hypothetical protein
LDNFLRYCWRDDKDIPSDDEGEGSDIKYLARLLWEMTADVNRTERSHNTQLRAFSNKD